MNSTTEIWRRSFPTATSGVHLFPEFEERAKAVSAEVFRVATLAEAREALLKLVEDANVKKAVVVEPEVEAPVLESADIISLEEVEEPGTEVAVEADEEIVDLGDDAPEIPAADDDNAFLEEEEEGEADVTGIVGTPGEET